MTSQQCLPLCAFVAALNLHAGLPRVRNGVELGRKEERSHGVVRLQAVYSSAERESDHTCTGSAIGPHHVLTAAHCVMDHKDGKDRVSVTVWQGSQSFRLARILLHPDFDQTLYTKKFTDEAHKLYPDVAVLELSDALPGPFLKLSAQAGQANDVIRLLGYGGSGEDEEEAFAQHPRNVLRKGTTLINKIYGEKTRFLSYFGYSFLKKPNYDNVVAGLLSVNEPGDSGGPVLNSAGEQIGVVAFCELTDSLVKRSLRKGNKEKEAELPVRNCGAVDVHDAKVAEFLQRQLPQH